MEKITLGINVEKTKILNIAKANPTNIHIRYGPVKEVNHFQYLARLMMQDGDTEGDLTGLAKASAVFHNLKLIWSATTQCLHQGTPLLFLSPFSVPLN